MKKFVLVGFLLLALAVMVPSVVMAGDAPKEPDQPEWGMLEGKCRIFTGHFGGYVWADAYWAYYASNNTHFLKCVGELPKWVTPPAESVKFSGFPCFTHAGFTWNSKTTIEPDGEVRLNCKVSP